eukprot:s3643_g4.t1
MAKFESRGVKIDSEAAHNHSELSELTTFQGWFKLHKDSTSSAFQLPEILEILVSFQLDTLSQSNSCSFSDLSSLSPDLGVLQTRMSSGSSVAHHLTEAEAAAGSGLTQAILWNAKLKNRQGNARKRAKSGAPQRGKAADEHRGLECKAIPVAESPTSPRAGKKPETAPSAAMSSRKVLEDLSMSQHRSMLPRKRQLLAKMEVEGESTEWSASKPPSRRIEDRRARHVSPRPGDRSQSSLQAGRLHGQEAQASPARSKTLQEWTWESRIGPSFGVFQFLDVRSVAMLRSVHSHNEQSEEVYLAYFAMVIQRLTLEARSLHRDVIWKNHNLLSAWQCLICLAAQPKGFKRESSTFLKLVGEASEEASGESAWILSQFVVYGCFEVKKIVMEKLDLIGNNLQAGPEDNHKAFAVGMVSCCKWMDKQWVGLLRRLLEPIHPMPTRSEEILKQLHDLCAACSDPALDYPVIMVVVQWYLRHVKCSGQRLRPQLQAVCGLFHLA